MTEPESSSEQSLVVASSAAIAMPRNRRTLRRRMLFRAMACLMVIVVLEIAAQLVMAFTNFSFESLRWRQNSIAAPHKDSSTPGEVLHPYLGWVRNPDATHARPVHPLGFSGTNSIIGRRTAGTLRIAIVGGSVALGLAETSSELIISALKERPEYQDVDVQVIPLAMAGYKQPQQLLQLNYLMSLGAEFDVVVNIDGYNEVALHEHENGRLNVFYAYPRAWYGRLLGVMDPIRVEQTFRVFDLKVRRIRLANWILRPPYRYSALLNVYWYWRDRWLRSQYLEYEFEVMTTERNDGLGYHITGPARLNLSGTELYEQLADLWMNSSVQIHRLCTANDMAYLHFLQPNQYVVGSKPLSDEERTKFIDPAQGYGKSAETGYPLLSGRGKQLEALGVRFHDLTNLFLKTTETVYSDRFCHLNVLGNEMLATAIVEEITRLRKGVRNQ